jgi:hypothetical protein
MSSKKAATILIHALIGWALCAATIGLGMATTSVENALIIHAAGAPVFFAVVSLYYFRRYHYTTPLQTALIFIAVVMAMDFFVVALLVLKSVDMFRDPLGTWIPFALILLSTYITGLLTIGSASRPAAA